MLPRSRSRSYKRLLSFPDAPRVQKIAAKLSVETAQPEIGLALIESMMETVDDPDLLQTYEEKRRLLILEVELKSFNRALEYFILDMNVPRAQWMS